MTAGKNTLVLLGQFGAPHGLKGEVRLKTYTQDPFSIADYGPLQSEDGRHFELSDLRPAKEVLIAKVKGVTDRNAAERLTNLKLYVERDVLGEAEEDDEFFHADLVGLGVEDETGMALGHVQALYDFGAGDMVEIKPIGGGKTILLPFTKAAVPVVDVAVGKLVVDRAVFDQAKDESKPDHE